ncbi:hypothetical protein BOTBODRAFT_35484 [Botryobasidium botryosum FD-172 SS1]|uniref:Uncharacterized protein n=1 Tax=Botryobasidium botryosum (strain FD-172 SS1) TaxID=930990 RepID=A0A067M6I7_BOTB1|nr:hypothetical protein BOTBODRAFT_35484 [Botryobasidium botryosum FD-172 SS1]
MDFEESAQLLRTQLPHRKLVWMREMGDVFDAGWVDRLARVLKNVKTFESVRRG